MSEANLFFEGRIIKIDDAEQVTEKFRKRAIVVETDENYAQQIQSEFTQDNCDKLDDFSVGDSVRIHFNIRGREWNGRYFTNLNGWRIERLGAAQPKKSLAESQAKYKEAKAAEPVIEDDGDDLPF